MSHDPPKTTDRRGVAVDASVARVETRARVMRDDVSSSSWTRDATETTTLLERTVTSTRDARGRAVDGERSSGC